MKRILRPYSIIGSGSGFTVNLGSNRMTLDQWACRIHFGFRFIVNSDPDPIIEYALKAKFHYAS